MKPLRIVTISARELRGSAELLRKYTDQRLTLTDAAGLHVMKLRSIQSCWSTDFHLGLTGVPLIIHRV